MDPTKEGQEQLLNIIKTILTNCNVLEEAIAEKQVPVNEQPPVTSDNPPLRGLDHIGQFSQETLDNIAKKIQNIILKSEELNKQVESIVMKKIDENAEQTKQEICYLKDKLDEAEQYSRRNCLLIHGVPETDNENTDEKVKAFCKSKLNIKLTDFDLDRSHRLRRHRNQHQENYPRPIIVKFVQHNLKAYVYSQKRLLKGSDFLLTESLTSKRMGCIQMLKKLRKEKKVNSYWTLDGRIYLTTKEDKILNLRSIDDFKYI